MPSWMGEFSQDRRVSELASNCAENMVTLLGLTGEGNEGGQAIAFLPLLKP